MMTMTLFLAAALLFGTACTLLAPAVIDLAVTLAAVAGVSFLLGRASGGKLSRTRRAL